MDLLMELLVGALLVLALVAIAIRFGLGASSGPRRLPRIVDDSIGMWALRRVTRRSLLGRPAGDRPDPLTRFRRPSTVVATRVPPPRRRDTRPPARSAPVAARVGAAPTTTAPAATPEMGSGPSDSWQVIPRRPAGRSFGSSILSTAEPVEARRPSRTTAILGYLGLAMVVAIVGFIMGVGLGAASTPGQSPVASGQGSAGSGILGSPRQTVLPSTSAGLDPSVRQP